MSTKGLASLATFLIAIVVILIGAFSFIERVPEGKTAVVYTPSGGASKAFGPGWHMIGLFEKTQEYPTRITIIEDSLTVTTSDGKKITMPVKYEMKVDKSKVIDIFKELGSQNIDEIQEGYLYQKLFKASREVLSQYSVIDVYGTKTAIASGEVTEKFSKSVSNLGFIITDVTLGTPELDKATQKAIDERVKAAQELEKLELEKRIAKETAEKLKIEAEGKATAKIAEAEGTAKANKIISESMTDEVLKKMELEARMKHGWVTIQGANAVVTEK